MSIPPYATVPLESRHNRAGFASGSAPLDRYLKEQATQDVRRNVAQVFVACVTDSDDVVAYYTLSMASVELSELPDAMSKRLPCYPRIPAALLGRLAVDSSRQRAGLGRILLLDAMRRSWEVSRRVAAYGLIVDALDERAASYYQSNDFTPLRNDASRLILPMATIERLFPWLPAPDIST